MCDYCDFDRTKPMLESFFFLFLFVVWSVGERTHSFFILVPCARGEEEFLCCMKRQVRCPLNPDTRFFFTRKTTTHTRKWYQHFETESHVTRLTAKHYSGGTTGDAFLFKKLQISHIP